MSASELRGSLRKILRYLDPYWELVNCHMVNFFTDNHWDTFVPESVKRNIKKTEDVDKCIKEVFWCSVESDEFKDVRYFVDNSRQFRLENMKHLLTSVEELQLILENDCSKRSLSIKEFMSEKKRHEVEITAELIHNLVEYTREKNQSETIVIDAGDGKGYLSSRLALQYEHKVLGIDFNETNTENALERSRKLQRAWNGLTERAELQSQGVTPLRRGKKYKSPLPARAQPENYKTTNQFITTHLDFNALIKELFTVQSDEKPHLCLTGLHTCGNLAPTCLNIFVAQKEFQILCNIGCCYHLLKEEFSTDEFYGNKTIVDKQLESGFPISNYLYAQQAKIGRNARMLAAQSIHRTVNAKELPNKSLFYRALLEVLIVQKDSSLKDTVQVGKMKRFSDFKEYVALCNKKANLGFEAITDEYLQDVERKYSNQIKFLELFYLIRMTFAPILETLILLDRLLYLKEQNVEQSYLIPLFDPVISPRCYCIVALK